VPTFVIHAMGQEPKKVTVDSHTVTVGRGKDQMLVLPGDTISRQHAVFVQEARGPWRVVCTSSTNAIVVDGDRVDTEAELSEGTEVLIGAEVLLVFIMREANAVKYMGARSVYGKSRCSRCGWEGMLSTLHVQPVCPACGSMQLTRFDEYDRVAAAREAHSQVTNPVGDTAARMQGQRIKEAVRSRIERMDNRIGKGVKKLAQSELMTISKKPDAALELAGIAIGEGLVVGWNGACYAIESKLSFPAMKINGEKRTKARLRNGDVIEVGKNRFRFVTE